ncbi:MAG: O-antigen ligase family protein [Alphaproteobacteria bacterium]|nr:O-antigen ligase family protein [Alphaproteobacteria bacterium]
MTEVERRFAVFKTLHGDSPLRLRLILAADGLAAALAVSLPWSTSATGILAAAWLIAVLPTLEPAAVRRVLLTPAGGLPVVFWALGLAGVLWATGIPFDERLNGLSSFHKFLFIPLLIAHFERSERGHWVLVGFLASCTALAAVSWGLMAQLGFRRDGSGIAAVPVKDYIAQSAELTFAAFLLAALAVRDWPTRGARAVLLIVLSIVFLLNVLIVTTSRTALVALPFLFVLFAFTQLRLRWATGLLIAGAAATALVWSADPYVRNNVSSIVTEVREFKPEADGTRAGERLEFWRKSVGIVQDAPLIGHGTGSIREQFRVRAEGHSGMAGMVSANPHNQMLAVALQLGLLGVAVLFALWIAHLRLFIGSSLAAWAGLLVVSQNFIGSLFNSHLFDFTHGWGYVIGVGVAGGVVLRGTADLMRGTRL